jgi:DNA-binding PadR family transcriptional regulator
MFRHHHKHREFFGRHPFGFHGHRFRDRMGRRATRVFDQGDLRFVILKLISEKESHGYDIIRAIEERVGGAYAPSPGVVYPTLNLLEEMGYATSRAEGGKKLFTITAEGSAALEANKASVDGIFRRMDEVHERFDGPAPRIGRAMENLGSAIRTRMNAGPVSDEQLNAIVDAIDAAAKKVETA